MYLPCPNGTPLFQVHKVHDSFSGKTSNNNPGLLLLAHIYYTWALNPLPLRTSNYEHHHLDSMPVVPCIQISILYHHNYNRSDIAQHCKFVLYKRKTINKELIEHTNILQLLTYISFEKNINKSKKYKTKHQLYIFNPTNLHVVCIDFPLPPRVCEMEMEMTYQSTQSLWACITFGFAASTPTTKLPFK